MKLYHYLVLVALFVPTISLADDQALAGGLPKVKHVIDTHIHLYDTARDGGVPWPYPEDKVIYKPHLPDEFNRVAKAAGVTGVVIVEASHLLPDNQGMLDMVEGDPFYLGLVGNVDPYREDYAEQIDKLRRDKRFVGVRARNKVNPIDFADKKVIESFRVLAERGLSVDILGDGKGTAAVEQIDKLAREIPDLRIIFDPPLGFKVDGSSPPADWVAAVKKLAENKNVYCKISGLYQRCIAQPASKDIATYRPALDVVWEAFGSKRLIYGSNWPCTKRSGNYQSYIDLVSAYFTERGQEACERYFWKNASEAYGLGLE